MHQMEHSASLTYFDKKTEDQYYFLIKLFNRELDHNYK